jgi:putative nucleotidyltransferase with HDIG domain
MGDSATTDPALESQCRRIAALSIALERTTRSQPERAAEIMDLAEALDSQFGWEPFDGGDEERHTFAEAALACLRMAGPEDLDRALRKLPVFPLAAQRALQVILRDDWNMWELQSIAGSDQALAAHLIRAANWEGPRFEVSSLSQAIAVIGADYASRIIYAASVQPMFASPQLRDLWHHSMAAAEVAEALARESRAVDPKVGFLAGLVHDIGILAMSAFPAAFQSLYRRLVSLGCETMRVERTLSGISHADAGARAAELWKFPGELRDAIAFHHAPERSPSKLASILYLTEEWTDSSEDVPSAARFRTALERLGLRREQFEQLAPANRPGFSGSGHLADVG